MDPPEGLSNNIRDIRPFLDRGSGKRTWWWFEFNPKKDSCVFYWDIQRYCPRVKIEGYYILPLPVHLSNEPFLRDALVPVVR